MAPKLFVNLPVKDLDETVRFFTALGFTFDKNFTDDNATCMNLNDEAFVMLLVEPFFQRFTKKGLADASSSTEVIMALSAGSRVEVDELADKALAAGAKPSNDPMNEGPMYSRSFQDVDDHLWEVFFMDEAAMGQ